MISFHATKKELELIGKIVERAMRIPHNDEFEYNHMTCHMDITACHANGTPLNLEALLSADDFNFSHDVFGIARHINRTTGQIEGCFVPRFALPVTA